MPRRVVEVKAFMRAERVELAATLPNGPEAVPIEATVAIGDIILPVRLATVDISPRSTDPVTVWPMPLSPEPMTPVVRLTLEIEGATLGLRDDTGAEAIIVDGDVARPVVADGDRARKRR